MVRLVPQAEEVAAVRRARLSVTITPRTKCVRPNLRIATPQISPPIPPMHGRGRAGWTRLRISSNDEQLAAAIIAIDLGELRIPHSQQARNP